MIVFNILSVNFISLFLDVTSNACFARGCTYDSAVQSGYPSCYVPLTKGGYVTSSVDKISDAVTQYKLSRVSKKPILIPNTNSRVNPRQPPSNLKKIVTTDPNEFSLYGHDIDHLNLRVSVSGTDMIRLTIRDAEKDRYEVPVPIRWQSASVSASVSPKIQFKMMKTSNGQAGFRIRRTDTQSILFDTSYFAHGFIYDNQFIQFITTIPSTNVYGKLLDHFSSTRHTKDGNCSKSDLILLV